MVLDLLVIPICFTPLALSHYWFDKLIPLIALIAFISGIIIFKYTFEKNKDMFGLDEYAETGVGGENREEKNKDKNDLR